MSRLFLMCLVFPAAALSAVPAKTVDESAPSSPSSPATATTTTSSADAASVVAAADAVPVIVEPAPLASASATTRSMSAVVASRIAAAAERLIEPRPDRREIDKPRNTIVRLPNFEVKAEKAPAIKPLEVLTPDQQLELALKRHPGLRIGSFWIFRNDGVAMTMLAEELRLERMRETNEMLTLLPAAQQKQLGPAVNDAFARWEWPR